MAILEPNVWYLEKMARLCAEDGPRKVPRGNRTFKVYVEEVDE